MEPKMYLCDDCGERFDKPEIAAVKVANLKIIKSETAHFKLCPKCFSPSIRQTLPKEPN